MPLFPGNCTVTASWTLADGTIAWTEECEILVSLDASTTNAPFLGFSVTGIGGVGPPCAYGDITGAPVFP